MIWPIFGKWSGLVRTVSAILPPPTAAFSACVQAGPSQAARQIVTRRSIVPLNFDAFAGFNDDAELFPAAPAHTSPTRQMERFGLTFSGTISAGQ